MSVYCSASDLQRDGVSKVDVGWLFLPTAQCVSQPAQGAVVLRGARPLPVHGHAADLQPRAGGRGRRSQPRRLTAARAGAGRLAPPLHATSA